jgi:coproporphyrinogen III oxidase-like Fe-S oxidoreductase
VDLVYGFEGEEHLGRNPLQELDTLLEHGPMGFHLYLMRSEATNGFYGKPREDRPGMSDRKKTWEVRTFGEAEDRLTERGYRPVYDEYCIGTNAIHAERTISFDARTGVIPNIVGIGVGAATHTRIMRYENVKSLTRYGQLLRHKTMPNETGVDYEASGMFPIAMIYFKIRHGAPVSIPTLTETLKLSDFEWRQIDGLFEQLARDEVPYRYNRGLFGIPERDYSRALSTIARYLEAGAVRSRVER